MSEATVGEKIEQVRGFLRRLGSEVHFQVPKIAVALQRAQGNAWNAAQMLVSELDVSRVRTEPDPRWTWADNPPLRRADVFRQTFQGELSEKLYDGLRERERLLFGMDNREETKRFLDDASYGMPVDLDAYGIPVRVDPKLPSGKVRVGKAEPFNLSTFDAVVTGVDMAAQSFEEQVQAETRKRWGGREQQRTRRLTPTAELHGQPSEDLCPRCGSNDVNRDPKPATMLRGRTVDCWCQGCDLRWDVPDSDEYGDPLVV